MATTRKVRSLGRAAVLRVLVLAVSVSACSRPEHAADQLAQPLQPFAQTWSSVLFFRVENSRWPRDKGELDQFARDQGLTLDTTKLAELEFDPQADGGLVVRGRYAPPLEGEFSVTVNAPSEGE